MPTYAYKARNASSQLVEGTLDGMASGAVAEVLFGQGLTPVEIRETKARAATAPSGWNAPLFRQKVSPLVCKL